MASRITSESQVDLAIIQVVSQKGAVDGYAGLDGTGRVATANLPDTVVYTSQIPSKDAVRVATTGNITLSGTQTIDTVSLATGERVLVKNQTTASENGIYVVAAGAWSRSADANTSAEVNPGMLVPVTDGNVNFGSLWSLYSPSVGPITLGTTAIDFVKVAAFDTVFPEQNNSFVGEQVFQNGSNAPVVLIPISSDPGSPPNGAIWVNSTSNDLKFADGTPTIQTVERTSRKNIASGYAGLDGSSRIAKAQGHSATVYTDQLNAYSAGSVQRFSHSATTSGVRIESTASNPSSPTNGDLWNNAGALRFYDGTAARTLEHQGNKNAASGYAGLDGSSKLTGSQQTYGLIANTAAEGDKVIRKDGSVAFTADQSMGAFKLTNVADPTNPQDAATKTYVDAIAVGLDVKKSVRAATTANITLSGTQTIDGVSVVAGNRVLVKNQTTGSENGIYDVAAGAWARSSDSDTSAEVTSGLFTFVEEGTASADSGWILTTNDPITLGSTSLTFTQFTGAGQITAGSGLSKTGNTLDVNVGDGIQIVADAVAVTADVERNANKNAASGYAGLDSGSRIAKAQGHSSTVYNDQANVYTAGMKQTFAGDATNAGMRHTGVASDPSTLANGDMWHNTTSSVIKTRLNGVSQILEHQGNKNAASGYAGLDSGSRIAKAQGHSATVYNDQANTYSAGSKQTFQNSATTAGANLASSADPSSLSQGDLWVNASDLKFRGAAATQTVERQANKGVASGYASLDSGTLVPVAQIPPAGVTDVFEWNVSGTFATGTDLDGLKTMPRDGSIISIRITERLRGSGGSTIVDVNRTVPTKPITTQRNATAPTGTTIFTTQANRPTLTGGTATESAVIQATAPDVTTFVNGDYFSIDIDAIATGAGANAPKDLCVQMVVQYTS